MESEMTKINFGQHKREYTMPNVCTILYKIQRCFKSVGCINPVRGWLVVFTKQCQQSKLTMITDYENITRSNLPEKTNF